MPSHGSDRPLFSQIKQMTQDAFGDLGGTNAPQNIPLHQAMVVLSDGSGRGDPESASMGAAGSASGKGVDYQGMPAIDPMAPRATVK